MKVKGYTVYDCDPTYASVELWQQPLWSWIKQAVYYWYSYYIYKVPGFKWLENRLWESHRGDESYVPLSAQQDERSFDLTRRNRKILAWLRLEIYDYAAFRRDHGFTEVGTDPST